MYKSPYFWSMAGNTWGQILRLTTFGESHGPAVGGVLDGVPGGTLLDLAAVQSAVNRRKTGQNPYASSRQESDSVEWLSGLEPGAPGQPVRALGTPIAFLVRNTNARSSDYDALQDVFRPSHADYTWWAKFGLRDARGGGRASARETVARVVAGDVARQILPQSVQGVAYVERLAGIGADPALLESGSVSSLQIQTESHPLRCPDAAVAAQMEQRLAELKEQGDTAGGVIAVRVDGVPAGWGEPVFDKLHAVLGHALLSINAVKGVEFGSGFSGAESIGSAHNDSFTGMGTTATNRSGGIQGGISNGNSLVFRVAFKPIASIAQPQQTVDVYGQPQELTVGGRHDATVLPRAVPIVEAMTYLVLADFYLLQRINRTA